MNWFLKSELARALDEFALTSRVAIVETRTHVIASQVAAAAARQVADAATEIGFQIFIEDASESYCVIQDISEEFAPYRLTILKPVIGDDEVLLTNTGFENSLSYAPPSSTVRIARLAISFDTLTCRYTSWEDLTQFDPAEKPKSPREVVRESGSPMAPAEVGSLILRTSADTLFQDAAFAIWARNAFISGIRALASEIGADTSLLFRGPGSVRLALRSKDFFDQQTFGHVQAALAWVFENPKETEMRHGLFASEISRLSGGRKDAIDVFSSFAQHALEGSRIALQLGLSELNRDALKVLSDLRKSVSDETSKILDNTRQLIGSISTSLFVGIGLIAAKLSNTTSGATLSLMAFVLLLYIGGIIVSGFSFIRIQRDLRAEWRVRAYAFLTDGEFDQMVSKPIRRAERGFNNAVVIGGFAALALVASAVVAASSTPVPPPL